MKINLWELLRRLVFAFVGDDAVLVNKTLRRIAEANGVVWKKSCREKDSNLGEALLKINFGSWYCYISIIGSAYFALWLE